MAESERRGGRQEVPYPSQTYAWYVVAVLMIAMTFSFIDRQILSLLVVPIRRDLDISDTQMSLLQGLAFALFYAVMGLPIGRLVDSKSRRGIIGIGIAFWSLMTAACGLAKNYTVLFVARMGVGVGEATLGPAAASILADYFRPERLGTAMGVYSTGIFIGAGLALIIGGAVIGALEGQHTLILPIVGEVYSWQAVFFIVGLPGLLAAALMVTVREPKRRGALRRKLVNGKEKIEDVPLAEIWAYWKANRGALLSHHFGFALMALYAYGIAAWIPTFFIRSFGWTGQEAGLYYGAIVMIFGSLGVAAGGWIADWLKQKGYQDGRVRVGLIMALGTLPFGLIFPLVDNAALALCLIAPTTFIASFGFGPASAALQEIMPNQMRGQAIALYILFNTLIGLGLGPTAVAVFTDFVFGDDLALRYSLMAVAVLATTLSATAFWFGLPRYQRSLDNLAVWQAEEDARLDAAALARSAAVAARD